MIPIPIFLIFSLAYPIFQSPLNLYQLFALHGRSMTNSSLSGCFSVPWRWNPKGAKELELKLGDAQVDTTVLIRVGKLKTLILRSPNFQVNVNVNCWCIVRSRCFPALLRDHCSRTPGSHPLNTQPNIMTIFQLPHAFGKRAIPAPFLLVPWTSCLDAAELI